ncbi:hypothetical protein, partial [Mesorhizobium sp. M8A.F.Ca.ET.198.01.1.1]|uniref:hypothetical protein n=1 Tax=Mesorhizobium sp. M8A.F.Ca.ET.198.01.1.1 TaxID=2563966 RepID=UPI00109361A4
LTQVVDPTDPVKISRLRIQNSGPAPARLRIYAYAEWVLGGHRSRTAATIVHSRDAATGAMLAQNPYGLDFGERVAFLAAAHPVQSVTADRSEFIGRHGTTENPQAVLGGLALSGRIEADDDRCAVAVRSEELRIG